MLDEADQLAVIRGLRDGHRDSWTALYQGYSQDIWRYVARLVGSANEDVADVVQETFLAAARSARRYDAERGTLWAWLTGIAHHRISIYWRQVNKQARLLQLAESRADQLHRWTESSDVTLEIWETRELADLVRATLASMSSEYASLLTAKYLDEQSLEAMTNWHGGSVDAMKSKLARARREFRVKFERLTQEPAIALNASGPASSTVKRK